MVCAVYIYTSSSYHYRFIAERNFSFFNCRFSHSNSSFSLHFAAMDFHSLPRKDLQFFCKKNQIPANMTNIAMADALKALEIVEGIEEFANRSPASVAKNLPSAARTVARRKTETQPSELVTRSCYVTSKSLAGETTDQENGNTLNVIPQGSRRRAVATNTTTVAMNLEEATKTPAARSTRRAAPQAAATAASCKKDESVQRAYSTRRSVKMLEETMADLSLITAKKKNEDVKSEDSSAGFKTEEEAEEVVSVRDLSGSMEKEWDSSGMKNDPDLDVLYGDLGDITFSDANMNAIESNTDSFVVVEEEEEQETSQEDDFVVVDHTKNQETESELIKNDSETETNDDVVVADSKQEAFVDSVTTVLVADGSKEVESEESESDEWPDTDFENDSELDEALVSDKQHTPASSSLSLAGNNNGEGKSEAEDKKKMSKEERLKDVSMRQLTKMVKELAIKSKQRPQHKYLE